MVVCGTKLLLPRLSSLATYMVVVALFKSVAHIINGFETWFVVYHVTIAILVYERRKCRGLWNKASMVP